MADSPTVGIPVLLPKSSKSQPYKQRKEAVKLEMIWAINLSKRQDQQLESFYFAEWVPRGAILPVTSRWFFSNKPMGR